MNLNASIKTYFQKQTYRKGITEQQQIHTSVNNFKDIALTSGTPKENVHMQTQTTLCPYDGQRVANDNH